MKKLEKNRNPKVEILLTVSIISTSRKNLVVATLVPLFAERLKSLLRIREVPIIFFLGVVLSACGGKENVSPTAYLPPTPASTPPTASQPAVVYIPPAAPAPQCDDNLYYLQDLTIPDGSQVAPGSTLDKQWLVENNGTCNWDHAYHLHLIAGPDLGAPVEQALYPARSGTQAIIRIQFVAPSEAGTYRSAWQAYDPQGIPFGDPIFIEIVVSP